MTPQVRPHVVNFLIQRVDGPKTITDSLNVFWSEFCCKTGFYTEIHYLQGFTPIHYLQLVRSNTCARHHSKASGRDGDRSDLEKNTCKPAYSKRNADSTGGL
ncbi:unnamed protein product [Nesidiocoris tenuis]|uniref:Uncharacterized protein n=1 Tax=Nesidiocoris tenuis TaxID=355587 RepID=A0A6H5H1Q2_9HEMI|nr:unnamed protein product [Nesidiocoris tenuis]CAB0010068.1 unnamed protein product [Nesidiocoris tenuis]